MPPEQDWIEWVFSGIGTYFVQLVVGFICFIFVCLFVKKASNDTKVEGDYFNVKQGGFFNKIKLLSKKKNK
ncbi:hypothetical protein [Vibrio panuliri]|uniref:Uncharacterized protein n=1 Tax=Vibrio panuliri TaxID=1381081 RepID=A0ABX3FLP0_9VIBR|nr:hypothetical protein [Vibrio panuliri]KAB1454556.1 hypothetical protein F7O85_16930 [Vibrio panuliri]OLQ95150.1 hypothetical protein BIY20_21385 [Vibrio panuliri]